MSHCLVLNADRRPLCMFPLSTLTWHEAIKSVVSEKTIVLHTYSSAVARSQKLRVDVPSVVVLKQFKNTDWNITFTRKGVYLRDDYVCQYCHQNFDYDHLTFDHVIPQCDGGRTTWDNVVSSCKPCNSYKGSKRVTPKIKPRKPTYWEVIRNIKKQDIVVPDSQWIDYLQWTGNVKVHQWSLVKELSSPHAGDIYDMV